MNETPAENSVPSVTIKADKEKLNAFLSVTNADASIPITEEVIYNLLKVKGIEIGVDSEKITELCMNQNFEEEVCIASGEPPVQGKDANWDLKIDKEKRSLVDIKTVVLEYVPSVQGKPGVNLFAEKIDPQEVKEKKKPDYKFLKKLEENENQYVAIDKGYITTSGVDDLSFELALSLEISKDKIHAYIVVAKPEFEDGLCSEDIIALLEQRDIHKGIKKDAISDIFIEENFNTVVEIASGKEPKNGKNGWIKYYFETDTSPKEDEYGSVDYKNIGLIQQVKKDDPLAEVFPPEKGVPGWTLYEEEIKANDGKAIEMPKGSNTIIDDKNPNLLKAGIDGRVIKKDKTIFVDPLVIINSNIDFQTGNIDFDGSIVIMGDVISGFKVKARDDVEIGGVVEDAQIEAGGSITLLSGYIGRGGGLIKAGNNVHVKFCENQTIIAKNNILVDNFIIGSKVYGSGKLIVEKDKGLIAGGEIYASGGVEAINLGSEQNVPTKINVGLNPEILENIKNLEEENENLDKELAKIELIFKQIADKKLASGGIPDELKDQLEQLVAVRKRDQGRKEEIKEDLKKLEVELTKDKDAIVVVKDTVYPGVDIKIQDKTFPVTYALREKIFFMGDEGVDSKPIKEEPEKIEPKSDKKESESKEKEEQTSPEKTVDKKTPLTEEVKDQSEGKTEKVNESGKIEAPEQNVGSGMEPERNKDATEKE